MRHMTVAFQTMSDAVGHNQHFRIEAAIYASAMQSFVRNVPGIVHVIVQDNMHLMGNNIGSAFHFGNAHASDCLSKFATYLAAAKSFRGLVVALCSMMTPGLLWC